METKETPFWCDQASNGVVTNCVENKFCSYQWWKLQCGVIISHVFS